MAKYPIEEDRIGDCSKCGKTETIVWQWHYSKEDYCTDCYLRLLGYDPDEIGKRFAALAKRLLADLGKKNG